MKGQDQLNKRLFKWVLNNIDDHTKIISTRKLKGSTSSMLYHMSLDSEQDYILRLFDQKDWVKKEPDLALHEAESLRYASQINIPTPENIAYEKHGRECGIPLVLMTFLSGSVLLNPLDMNKWIDGLAATLVKIHRFDGQEFGWEYFSYQDIHTFTVPSWSTVPELWEQAIQIMKGPQPKEKICFIHRDYHPANVLWHGDKVSGVVDWVNACRGPAGIDIGHCRVNLALLYGVEVADLFLKSYEKNAKAKQLNQTYWDLRSVIDISFGPPTVYPGWEAFGVMGLTDGMMEERLDLYMESIFNNKCDEKMIMEGGS